MTDIAPLFRAPEALTSHTVLGITHHYLARASETGGAFMTYEIDVPHGAVVPMHCHDEDAESFQILEGELLFVTPGGERLARRGEFAAFPAGCVHGFANQSGKPVRALIVQAPGIEAEKFFFAMAADHPATPDAVMAKVMELAPEHGIRPWQAG